MEKYLLKWLKDMYIKLIRMMELLKYKANEIKLFIRNKQEFKIVWKIN